MFSRSSSVNGHSDRMFWCEFSPSENNNFHLATASADGKVKIWDTSSTESNPKCIRSFNSHSNEVEVLRVSWSHDGDFLASGGSDGVVRTWSLRESSKLPKLEIHCVDAEASKEGKGQVYGLVYSTDTLAAGYENTVALFDKETGDRLVSWDYQAKGQGSVGGPRNPDNISFVFDITLSHPGSPHTLLASALSDGTARFRDIRNPLKDTAVVAVNKRYATSCAFSMENDLVAVTGGDGINSVVDMRTWKPLYELGVQNGAPNYGGLYWASSKLKKLFMGKLNAEEFSKFSNVVGDSNEVLVTWSSKGTLFFWVSGQLAFSLPSATEGFYPVFSCALGANNMMAVCGGTTPEKSGSVLGLRQANAATCLRAPPLGKGCKLEGQSNPNVVDWHLLRV
mmetsp:Transcript_14333/g.18821  ORF Transcript_14333/g.18821 Transcript_14333/m.18821 type:complete len:395 (-) Transcript_14333:1525-2709(-)